MPRTLTKPASGRTSFVSASKTNKETFDFVKRVTYTAALAARFSRSDDEAIRMRTPGTHRRRVITGVALYCMALSALVWALALFASPCEFYWASDRKSCEGVMTTVISSVESLNFLGSYVMAILYLYSWTFWRAVRMRRGGRLGLRQAEEAEERGEENEDEDGGEEMDEALLRRVKSASSGTRRRPTEWSPLPTSHWTAASSYDVFVQSSKTMADVRRTVAPFIFLAAMSSSLYYAVKWAAGQPVSLADANEVCTPEMGDVCDVAWHGDYIVFGLSLSLMMYQGMIFILSPDVLWSQSTLYAIRKRGDWRLARMRRLHLLLLFPVLVTFFLLILFVLVDPREYPYSRYAVFFINCASVVYQTIAVIWLHFPCGAPAAPADATALANDLQGQATTRRGSLSLWQTAHLQLSRLWKTKEAGIRVRRESFMVVISLLFAPRETFLWFKLAPAVPIILWVLRLCALLLWAITRDEEVGHDYLRESGAAFGLVLDAHDLSRALTYTLKHGRPYPKRIRTYKASFTRMQEAVAISYRWQRGDRAIASGQGINMSTWQLETMQKALSMSTCIYVWLDKMSVPQDGSELQLTLLSRMMAVYASAGCTLVLRSKESEGGRYHQRGWTVQEFCSCSQAAIFTEPEDATDDADEEQPVASGPTQSAFAARENGTLGASGVHKSEERFFWSLRKWHLQRSALCKPLWLSNGQLRDAVLHTATAKFRELRLRVFTQESADLVRALVPMLANCPVETQAEMVLLLKQMNEFDDDLTRYLQMLDTDDTENGEKSCQNFTSVDVSQEEQGQLPGSAVVFDNIEAGSGRP